MKIKKLNPIKSAENVVFKCERMNFLIKNKGSPSKEHTHEKIEHIFLVEGKIKLKVGNEIKIIDAPVKIEIPAKTKHKLIPITNCKMLYY